MNLDTKQTVGEIARQYPAAVPVFEALGIDYCCGGNKSLEDACAKGNVSLNLVLSDLSSALVARPSEDERHWMTSSSAELSAYIVEQHHAYAKRELPRLAALAAKVQARHGHVHPELHKIRELVDTMKSEIQAHGQAQMFGWIGAFVIGIGFYSLSKMGRLMPFAVSRGWQSWALWTPGIALHWIAGVYEWHWRLIFPFSNFLMLAGFLAFFYTIRQHRPKRSSLPVIRTSEIWTRLVLASTLAFLAALLLNLGGSIYVALRESAPALPPALDQRLVLLSAWGFLAMSVWGFNTRWLPIFLGLPQPNAYGLLAALATLTAALLAGLAGMAAFCSVLLIAASALAAWSLYVFRKSIQPAKLQGIHRSFPYFIRVAYVWLLTAAVLTLCASLFDHNGGIMGASRHALTVGFIGTMVFAIGPRILPAFCGMRVLFSPRLMFYALFILNLGCLLRVSCEIPAYEMNLALAWALLPVSAVAELSAVMLFVFNLLATFARPPAHLAAQRVAA